MLRSARLALLPSAAGAALLLSGLLPDGAKAASAANNPRAGVVDVYTNLGYAQTSGAGTGIVLSSSGEVVTNNHVIRGATRIRVTVPSTGRSYSATVVGYSVSADVAVLKVANASGLQTATLGNSATIKLGEAVTAVGNAGGVGGTPTITTGEVSGLHRSITVGDDQGGAVRLTDLIRTTAALEPGDSGGPLLDRSGRVIGIDAAASSRFAAVGSEGYAIPINRAMSIVKLIEVGRSTAAVHVGPTSFLGISVGRSDGSFSLPRSGAVVAAVLSGSPADNVGLAAGDVITSLGGRRVSSPAGLVNALLRTSPGTTVKLRWIDELGTLHSATVRPASGPPQ